MPLLYHWEQSRFLADNPDRVDRKDLELSQDSSTLQAIGGERMAAFAGGLGVATPGVRWHLRGC